VDSAYDSTEAKQIQELKKRIRASNHKAFIIKQDPGNPVYRPAWEVVTVDSSQSDPRLQEEGQYQILSWRPKEDDAKK
jgi:hypothetical protein